MDNKNINYAEITSKNLEILNHMQGQMKTTEGKDIILIAYEK